MKKFFKSFGMAALWLVGFIFIEVISSIIAMFFLDANASVYEITFLGLVIAAIPSIALLFKKDKYGRYKALRKPKSENVFFSFFGGAIFYVLISYFLVILFLLLPKNITDTYTVGEEVSQVSSRLLLFLSTGICAPIIEEVFFRYGVQSSLQKINVVFALFAQAVLFGIAHGNIIQGVYAFVVGVVLGFVYYKTQNLLYPIIIHLTFNSINFVVSELELTSHTFAFLVALFSFVFGWLIVRWKDKKCEKEIKEAIAIFPSTLSAPVDKSLIKKVERSLEINFADDYKYFLSTYGFLHFNDFFINSINCQAPNDVFFSTMYFRDVKRIPKEFYVLRCFENGETAILQDKTGRVYYYNNFGAIVVLCESLSKFIKLESQRIIVPENTMFIPYKTNI